MREGYGCTAVMGRGGYSRSSFSRESQARRNGLRRRRETLRRRRITAVCMIAASLFLIICLSGFSRAEAKRVDSFKYYTAVTVNSNDTLWDIALEHLTDGYSSVSEYIREIKEINEMKSDTIYYGQRLVLPYYSPVEK